MLSYRHGFHAGNHADVLKHIILCLLLRELTGKDKPFSLLDTHAGGGLYDLSSEFALKNREYLSGISKVITNAKLRNLVPEYFEVIDKLNPDGKLTRYPGSPYFEDLLARSQDQVSIVDLHPSEIASLHHFFHHHEHMHIHKRDSFEAMQGLLPPQPRRGLCFIDPSYEQEHDYYQLVKAVKQALARWNTGIFAIWYPVLARRIDHSRQLVQEIRRLGYPLLQAEINVKAQAENIGMNGSGMLILNYPYNLEKEITAVMGPLAQALCAKDGSAKFKVLVPRP